MLWWLIFGGIAVFAIVVFARLGVVLWRKLRSLFDEIRVAEETIREHLETSASRSQPEGRTIGHDARETAN